MTAPITRHQRELCNLAIVVAQQQESIDGLLRSFEELDKSRATMRDELESLREERDTLLAENATLRADIDGLEGVIHELVEDRWWKRYRARNDAKAWRDDRITVGGLRAELKRLKGKRHAKS